MPAPGNRHATSTHTMVIFAVSVRSYRWAVGASPSACAITPLASSSSSSPCRSSSASQSVQNPGPDAEYGRRFRIRDRVLLLGCAGGMDEGIAAMANWAGNKSSR